MPRCVLAGDDAWLLAPAEMVAAPAVLDAKWSSDGGYLLASRMAARVQLPPIQNISDGSAPPPEPKGNLSLVLWDQLAGYAREVWSQPLGKETIRQFTWLSGTDIAMVSLTWDEKIMRAVTDRTTGNIQNIEDTKPHQRLLRVIASTGKVEGIGEINGQEELTVSPLRPFAVLRYTEGHPERIPQPDGKVQTIFHWDSSLRVLHADGSIGPPAHLPDDVGFTDETSWSEDGNVFYWHGNKFTLVNGKYKPTSVWYAFDARNGDLQALSAAPKGYQEPPPAFPLHLKQSAATLSEGETSQNLRALWLESPMQSDQPRALVCPDGEWGLASPGGRAALYYAQGAAWVVPLVRVEKKVYLEARRKALRMVAISNAKQIGLALMMYAQDYDEQLPGRGQDVSSLIQPYLQNTGITNGFNYQFPGGTLGSIASPADTILGTVPGPGGVAVIFADGHVVWRGD